MTVQAIRDRLKEFLEDYRDNRYPDDDVIEVASALLAQHAAEAQALREERDKLQTGLHDTTLAWASAADDRDLYSGQKAQAEAAIQELKKELAEYQTLKPRLAQLHAAQARLKDAAEMLWVVLAHVSGGDWTQQSTEWQEAAAKWHQNYFAALATPAPTKEP